MCAEAGPVGAIKMRGMVQGIRFWRELLERGIYVNLLVPPATPGGDVLLRFSISAAHSEADIDKFVAVLRDMSVQALSA